MLLKDLADYKIVLASLSPRRQELLSQLGIVLVFVIVTNEINPKGLSVYETVQYLAQQKLKSFLNPIKSSKMSLL